MGWNQKLVTDTDRRVTKKQLKEMYDCDDAQR